MAPPDSSTTPPSPLTSRTALLRGSGVLGMIAGVCWALETLFHPVRNITTLGMDAKAAGRWELVHTIGLAGFVLALFAVIGFYLIQREQSGVLGLSGFVLLFTGLALGIGGYSPDAYVFPVLAKHSATACAGYMGYPPGKLRVSSSVIWCFDDEMHVESSLGGTSLPSLAAAH